MALFGHQTVPGYLVTVIFSVACAVLMVQTGKRQQTLVERKGPNVQLWTAGSIWCDLVCPFFGGRGVSMTLQFQMFDALIPKGSYIMTAPIWNEQWRLLWPGGAWLLLWKTKIVHQWRLRLQQFCKRPPRQPLFSPDAQWRPAQRCQDRNKTGPAAAAAATQHTHSPHMHL